ncbi:MAG: FtsX-like permease family protein [Deltaproteobacteria bacterium]|nr:FtsX-like permease family protein [Deltaproteobacteria bacterium]
MRILLGIALRNLVQSRRRTALVGVAIGGVTLLLVCLLALADGVRDNLVRAATTISAGHVSVAGFFKPNATNLNAIVTGRAALRKLVEENVDGLDYIVERHRGWGKVVGNEGTLQVGFSGVVAEDEPALFDTLSLAWESEYLAGGRDEVIGDPRELAEPGTMVLFAAQARRLGVRVGDTVTIKTETLSGQTNTADARIVAVARDLGLLSSYAVFVDRGLILDLYRYNEDTTGAFWIYLEDIDRADEVMRTLRTAIAEAGYALREHESDPFYFKVSRVQTEDWTGQQIDVTTWRDEVSFLTFIVTGFSVLTWLITTILVSVIAVGIMNAIWTAVRERTREVGTMRAVGLSRGRVLALFLLEAALLGLVSSSAGAILGLGLITLLDALSIRIPAEAAQVILLSDTLHLRITPQALASAVGVLTLLTAASAIWPSVQAAALRPVKALQHAE